MTNVNTQFLTQLLQSQIDLTQHLAFATLACVLLGAALVFALSKVK